MEFVMPADTLLWEFNLIVSRPEFSPGFTGSTRVVVKNVTRDTVILDVTERVAMLTTLEGAAGDVIRISFDSEGEGSIPSGLPTISGYDGSLNTNFTIPEPGTIVLISVGTLAAIRRRNRSCLHGSNRDCLLFASNRAGRHSVIVPFFFALDGWHGPRLRGHA